MELTTSIMDIDIYFIYICISQIRFLIYHGLPTPKYPDSHGSSTGITVWEYYRSSTFHARHLLSSFPVFFLPVDICQLPADIGPCDGVCSRWFFNTETGSCEQFDFGCCDGNENNFETQADCIRECGGGEVVMPRVKINTSIEN